MKRLIVAIVFLGGCGDNLDGAGGAGVCGDGVVNVDEGCDDGNTVDGDGCDSNCSLPGCGNGILGFNEGCDDGNTVSGDGCDSNCTQTFCGNGVKAGDEECDDGNTTSGDGCDNNCKPTKCGNGVMTNGEGCDDGNAVEGDGCDTNCTTSSCGNGIKAGPEQCDDGNKDSADGCSASCATETLEVEPNEDGTPSTGGSGIAGNDFGTTTAMEFTTSATIIAALTPMGDEDVFKFTNTGTTAVRLKLDTWNLAVGFGIGMSCNTNSIDTGINIRNAAGTVLASNNDRLSTDYCAAIVHPLFPGESVYAHVTEFGDNAVVASYALDVVFQPVVCGDGDVGPGEQCDDTNTNAGDGCSATCQIEGAMTEIEPNEDGTPSTGGSGINGNDFGSANALANGTITGNTTFIASITPAGDEDVFAFRNMGATAATVKLDVWNLATGYGIGVPCGTSIDTGLHVRDAAGGSLASNDDRNGATDRCSTITLGLLPGQTRFAHVSDYGDSDLITTYALVVKYTPVVCGDGMLGTGEECDDMNTTNGDGCDSTCHIEPNCGDAVLQPTEQCDDGNTMNGDGCSMTCTLEGAVTETEPNEDGSISTGGSGITGNDFSIVNAGTPFTSNVTIAARIRAAGDEDVFAFRNTGTAFVNLKIDLWSLLPTYGIGTPCGTTTDTGLQIKDAAGAVLASNDDRNGASDRCSVVTVGVAPGATVYAQVVEYGDDAEIPSYALVAAFTPVVCGDGNIGPGEQCDDMNTTNGDGCSATCQIEAICGDGVLQPSEQCEDHNTTNGDGCSSTCTVEAIAEVEPNATSAEADASTVQISGDKIISGAVGTVGDLDRFKVTVGTATTIRFEAFAGQLGTCNATVDLRLFDSAGASILADTLGAGINGCGAIVIFLAAGTYYIQLEERGNNATIPQYYLDIAFQDDAGIETEPNDTNAQATTSLVDESFVFGDHTTVADLDVYAIMVPAGARIRAEIVEGDRATETCESNGIDTGLTLLDENGNQLVDDDDDGRGFCSLIDGSGATPLDSAAKNATATDKIYYLKVRAVGSGIAGQFVYRLQLTIR